MRRTAAASLALLLTVALAGGCAEYTTTGVPADETPLAEGVGESLAPEVDQLSGTTWRLASSSAEQVRPEDFTITADFADGHMAGQAPVNRYTASYTIDGETITLGPVAGTRMAGPDDAMAAEAAYFALLVTVTGFHLDGDELALLAGEKPVLEYEKRDPVNDQLATTQKFAETLVGMKTADAQKKAEDAGYTFRIVEEDGVPKAVTADLQPKRVNATVEKGVVTAATAG